MKSTEKTTCMLRGECLEYVDSPETDQVYAIRKTSEKYLSVTVHALVYTTGATNLKMAKSWIKTDIDRTIKSNIESKK